MLTRRNIAKIIGGGAALTALAACAGTPGANTSPSNATVVTVAQAQAWVRVLAAEVPMFLQESIATGLIKGAQVTTAETAQTTFTTLANQFLAPTFDVSNAVAVASQIAVALTTILSVIPQTAPYVAFVQLGMAVIVGLISAQPMVVPAVPAASQLQAMHVQTLKFHN
jgi:hypothetical protein